VSNSGAICPKKGPHLYAQFLTGPLTHASSRALEANKIALWTLLFSRFPGTTFHDDPGILWFETGIRHDIFNRVLQTRLEPSALPSTLDRVLGSFQERRLPFLYHLGPSSLPSNLGSHLQERALIHYETEPGMAVDLHRINEDIPVAPQLIIQPVTTHEQLRQWIGVWEAGSPSDVIDLWFTLYSGICFDVENPLLLFLGLLDGKPVATSGLFCGSEVASIGPVGTLPPYRRQGIGAAMTLSTLQEARRQGYHIGVLTASPMGITTYRRIGFQEVCTFSLYLWHPTY
jgi:GNAT superfamily N-acetyltransferase